MNKIQGMMFETLVFSSHPHAPPLQNPGDSKMRRKA